MSTRKHHGWSKAETLPPSINTQQHELTPFVTSDGNWLFFSRSGDLYWVSTKAIWHD